MGHFFPELAFGWLFCLGLLGWMAVAAVQDLRRGLAGTLGLVAVFAALRIGQRVFTGSGANFTTHPVSDRRRKPALGARRALTTYSLPAALSTAGVLLIVFHRELRLLP